MTKSALHENRSLRSSYSLCRAFPLCNSLDYDIYLRPVSSTCRGRLDLCLMGLPLTWNSTELFLRYRMCCIATALDALVRKYGSRKVTTIWESDNGDGEGCDLCWMAFYLFLYPRTSKRLPDWHSYSTRLGLWSSEGPRADPLRLRRTVRGSQLPYRN